jgi:hypothetical protein
MLPEDAHVYVQADQAVEQYQQHGDRIAQIAEKVFSQHHDQIGFGARRIQHPSEIGQRIIRLRKQMNQTNERIDQKQLVDVSGLFVVGHII